MVRPEAYRGDQRLVVYAVAAGGASPAQEFFRNLVPRDQAKVLKLFQMLGDRGRIQNREKFKAIEGTQFFEFKSRQIRMPCCQEGPVWIVTHGFIKKGDRIDPEQIRRAERIRDEDEIVFQAGSSAGPKKRK